MYFNLFYVYKLFNNALSAGLRFRQPDALITRLDLIHTRLELIHPRLDLIHTKLDLIHSGLYVNHTRLDTRLDLIICIVNEKVKIEHVSWLQWKGKEFKKECG